MSGTTGRSRASTNHKRRPSTARTRSRSGGAATTSRRHRWQTTIPATHDSTADIAEDTLARVLPYWQDRIAPRLRAGDNVLVAAHGNSLRALVKMLDGVSDAEITELNIPTGVPLVYDLNDSLAPLHREYLGDPEAVRKASEAVARQGRR
jgi:2,3-bisphosphoglycerate-dependent phosphoglycerate mutase